MRYLTTAHALKTLKLIEEQDLFLGIICDALWQTGRRIGELLSLSLSKCETREKDVILIFFKEKTRESMNRHRSTISVCLSRESWERWQKKLKESGCPSGRTYIFSRKKREKELYSTIYSKYLRIIKKLSQDHSIIYEILLQQNNRFHIWRHSYAYSMYHDLEYDLSSLQEAMGHESVETTKSFYGDWFFPPERRFLDRNLLEEKYNHLGFCNSNVA